MSPPVAQRYDKPEVWAHDSAIEDHHTVYRVCKTGWQIALDRATGEYIFSDQVYSTYRGGCSVELVALVTNENLGPQQRMAAHGGVGLLELRVEHLRGATNKDNKGRAVGNLDIAYTPLPDDCPDGPNEFHADIFPKMGGSAQNHLKKASSTVIPLDQNLAEELYRRRNGQ